jgi:hypothetical protein
MRKISVMAKTRRLLALAVLAFCAIAHGQGIVFELLEGSRIGRMRECLGEPRFSYLQGTFVGTIRQTNEGASCTAEEFNFVCPAEPDLRVEGHGVYSLGLSSCASGVWSVSRDLFLTINEGEEMYFGSEPGFIEGLPPFPDVFLGGRTSREQDEDCFTAALFAAPLAEYRGFFFRRGDANSDGQVNLADVVFLLSYVFADSSRPECLDAADANDDGHVNAEDATTTVGFLFLGNGPISVPHPLCGTDSTEDELGCTYYYYSDIFAHNTPTSPFSAAVRLSGRSVSRRGRLIAADAQMRRAMTTFSVTALLSCGSPFL